MMVKTESKLVELAKEALRHPRDFMYYGSNEQMFESWGYVWGYGRGADVMDESNFWTVYNRLKEQFPDDVEVHRSNHWLCGWVEQLAVRILKPDADSKEFRDEDVTDAFREVLRFKTRVENYPVLDEEDYSEREWREMLEFVRACGVEEENAERVLKNIMKHEDCAAHTEDLEDEMVAHALERLLLDAPPVTVHAARVNLTGREDVDVPVEELVQMRSAKRLRAWKYDESDPLVDGVLVVVLPPGFVEVFVELDVQQFAEDDDWSDEGESGA